MKCFSCGSELGDSHYLCRICVKKFCERCAELHEQAEDHFGMVLVVEALKIRKSSCGVLKELELNLEKGFIRVTEIAGGREKSVQIYLSPDEMRTLKEAII